MGKMSRKVIYILLALLLILSNTAVSATPSDVPGSLVSDTIDPTTAGFDKEIANQSDIQINLSVDGNALREIRNGTYILQLDADYSVAHKTVTINKSYLAKQPAGTADIDFIFKSGKQRTLKIDIAPADSAISPVKAGFDKNKASQADVRLEMVLNGNILNSIMNGAVMLVSGADYTVSGNIVTIDRSYLAKQPVGTATLSFKFNEGGDQALVIEISDTTPGFISMPVPNAPYYTMINGSFEAGKSAWGEYIANGAVAPEAATDAKEGTSSIKLDNKSGGFTSMWNTTLPVNKQKNMPAAGDLIQVGAWVKVGSDADTSKSFKIQIEAADSSDKKTTILNTPSLAGIQADTWVYVVSSPAQIPAGTAYLVTSFQDEMPGAIQIDDVKVFHYPSGYALGNGSFENALSAWGQDNSNNAAVISVVPDAKEGTSSVKLVNTESSKASIWNSTLQINGQEGMPAVGDVIQVGAWIKVGAGADTSKQFILKAEGFDGVNKALVSYITSLAGLKPDTWTFVLAPAVPVPAGQTAVTVAIEDSVPGTVQVDGIRLFHYPTAYAMTNGNFETAKNTWGEYIANGAVAPEIATDAKEGASAIKLDNKTGGFTSMWNTTLAVNGQANMPVVGDMIQIGAWVKLGLDANTAQPFAIQVEADTGSEPKPLLVKTQSLTGVQADTWTYIVSGVAQVPAGTNALAVSFQDNMPGSIQIDDVRIFNYNPPAAVKNSTISLGAVNFDKKNSNQQDVSVTMTLNDNTLTGVFDGETQLVQDTGYTLSGSIVTILKGYLAAQGTGLKKLTFKFSAGLNQTLNINIIDTTPVNHTPVAAAPASQNIVVGQQMRFAGAWLAIDPDIGDVLSVSAVSAVTPEVVTVSVSNGYLLVEGASEGSTGVTAEVRDSQNAAVSVTFNITVSTGTVPVNTTPQALTLLVQSFTAGQSAAYTGDQLAMDTDAGELLSITGAVSGTPDIVGISVADGQLLVTAAGVGTTTVTATVKDSHNAQTDVTFDVVVSGFAYTMVSPGFEDYTTPDNDFSWGIYPTTLYGTGSNPPWNHNGFGIVTDNVHGGEKALASSAGGALWQRVYQKDGVQDGDFVQTSVWVYAYPGTTGFKVQVDALDNAETHTVIAQSREIDANDQGKWVLLQTNPIKSIPLGTTKGIVIAANSQTGDIILDDFVTSRVGHETPKDNNAAFAYPQRSVYPLQNGDFEDADTTPWGTWGTVSVAAEESYFGSKSVKFVNTASTNTAIWQGASIGTGANDPKAGQGVEAGLWVYFANGTDFTGKDFYIDINAVDGSNVQTLLAKSDSITSSTPKGKWIYIKTKPVNGGLIPEGTVYVQVSIQNTVVGTVYADLIQMGETNAVNGNPAKMAFFAYQPWYGNVAEGGSADWYNWAWTDSRISHNPNDILSNGNRDVASALYPIVGAYSSTDTELLQYQFDIAKAAHIDGFMINDYGKEIKQDYRVCEEKMFDIADQMGMKIGLQYEPKIHFAGWVPSTAALPRSNMVDGVEQGSQLRGIIDDLEYILQKYAPRKSYLKYNGLPVINPFGAGLVSSSEWDKIKQTIIDEGYGDFILMADTAPSDPTKYTSFASTYNWHMMSSATDPSNGPTYDKVYAWGIGNDKGSYDWVAGDMENRFGVGLVFPGFNDSGVGGNWGSGTDRIAAYLAKDDPDHPWMGPADPKGDTLTATQNAILNSKVNWVVYATLNDWNEATVVEPSEEFGYKFIIEAQNFMELFKGLPLTEADDSLMQQITEAYIANRTAKFK